MPQKYCCVKGQLIKYLQQFTISELLCPVGNKQSCAGGLRKQAAAGSRRSWYRSACSRGCRKDEALQAMCLVRARSDRSVVGVQLRLSEPRGLLSAPLHGGKLPSSVSSINLSLPKLKRKCQCRLSSLILHRYKQGLLSKQISQSYHLSIAAQERWPHNTREPTTNKQWRGLLSALQAQLHCQCT